MDKVSGLKQSLAKCFDWNKARLDCFARMLLALYTVRTVNLKSIADRFCSRADKKSRYRRLKRFFCEFDFNFNLLARLILTPNDLFMIFFNTSIDIVLMRKDPPVDMEYIYTTLLLDLAEKQGVRVINNPQALRDANEKLFISWFPQCCVPALMTSSTEQIKAFLEINQDIIIKPLNGMGGKGIFRIKEHDYNFNAIVEAVTQNNTTHAMVQQYIPAVKHGDKRVIMMHGEPIPYTISRLARKGETRSNLAAGGSWAKSELTDRDRWICAEVGPAIVSKGILFAGLDIIGDYLTEINVTSPTCLREIDKGHNINTSAYFFDGL